MKYVFTILHNNECNFWETVKHDLESLAKQKELDCTIEDVLVANDGEARRWKFAGSPQLLINGKDIDPMADRITNYHASGCRPVVWKGKLYEYVPVEMIAAALD